MAQSDDLAQAAVRLEAALERIAHATARRREAATLDAGPTGQPTDPALTTEVASRLDTLIAQLRRALTAAGNPSR